MNYKSKFQNLQKEQNLSHTQQQNPRSFLMSEYTIIVSDYDLNRAFGPQINKDSLHVPFFTFHSIRGNNKDILWVTLDQVYISTHKNI